MIPSVLELLLAEQAELDDELAEIQATETAVEYGTDLRLSRRERRLVLKKLEGRRIRALTNLALCDTALINL